MTTLQFCLDNPRGDRGRSPKLNIRCASTKVRRCVVVGRNTVLKTSWDDALKIVRKNMKAVEFRSWIQPVRPLELQEDTLRVMVKDAEFQLWFVQKYENLLEQALEKVLERPVKLSYRIQEPELFDEAEPTPSNVPSPTISAQYRFENFVVGPSNNMAYAAGLAVGGRPGKSYNPLFIYGGTGLGKTHLLHAIGNKAREARPGTRVLYITSETYVNDLMVSIRKQRMEQFRCKYRDFCDVLLVDDVQFLAGKDRTQMEFFHTFNALHAAGKQIVFTSDRFPHELSDVEERLRSRFEWGLIADIKQPELETRIAILQHKAEHLFKLHLPDDVALFIAREISDNVRELESCLTRLDLEIRTSGTEVSIKMASNCLKSYLKHRARNNTVEGIQKAVATRFGVSVDELTSKSRKKTLADPRHVAMFLSRKLAQASFPEIGDKFGGRDHTSVMAACRKIENAIRLDNSLQQTVNDLEGRLKR